MAQDDWIVSTKRNIPETQDPLVPRPRLFDLPEAVPLLEFEINPGEMSVLRAFQQQTEADYSKLERFFRYMFEWWRRDDPYLFTGFFNVAYGELCFERNELEEAEKLVLQGIDIAKRHKSGKLLAPAAASLSDIYRAQHRSTESFNILSEAENALNEWGAGYWAGQIQLQRLRLKMRDARTLTPELEKDIRSKIEANMPHLHFFTALTAVRGFMASERLDEALTWLSRLEEKAERQRRAGELQEICMLRALCFMRRYETERAVASISRALSMAEPNGSVRPFLDEMPEMAALLIHGMLSPHRLPSEGKPVSASFVKRLLNAVPSAAPVRKRVVASEKANLLTPKEKEVLDLLVTGMPNRMIAERLGITVEALKTHINRIYQKLQYR